MYRLVTSSRLTLAPRQVLLLGRVLPAAATRTSGTTPPTSCFSTTTRTGSNNKSNKNLYNFPVASIRLNQHQHAYMTVRSFGKKKGKGGGGGGDKMLKVFPIWSGEEDEVQEVFQSQEEDEFVKIKPGAKDLMQQLRNVVLDQDEDDPDLQVKIFNSQTNEFELLQDVEQVKREAKAKQGRVALTTEVPDDYEAEDYADGAEQYNDDDADYDTDQYDPDLDEDDEDYYKNLDGPVFWHDKRVRTLIDTLKKEGWQRAEVTGPHLGDSMLTNANTMQEKHTKDVILQLANQDEELQEYLIGAVGALDHLVTCTHFDFVWDTNSPDDDNDYEVVSDDDEDKGEPR